MTQLATDNFTRANSSDLGTAWDVCTGEIPEGFDIVTNTARADSTQLGADASETNNSATWPSNQYSETTLGTVSAAGLGAGYGPTCRAATGATVTYYRVVGCSSGWELGKKVAGAFTSITSSSTAVANGDIIKLEVNGTSLKVYKNGAQVGTTQTDASIASGRAGVAYSSVASSSDTISLWSGGDLSSGASSILAPKHTYFSNLMSL